MAVASHVLETTDQAALVLEVQRRPAATQRAVALGPYQSRRFITCMASSRAEVTAGQVITDMAEAAMALVRQTRVIKIPALPAD